MQELKTLANKHLARAEETDWLADHFYVERLVCAVRDLELLPENKKGVV